MSPADSGSEGESAEKPVRERLKHTTIAKEGQDTGDDEAGTNDNHGAPNGSASRPTRKRSFEDMGKLEPPGSSTNAAENEPSARLRKRTKELESPGHASAPGEGPDGEGNDEDMANAHNEPGDEANAASKPGTPPKGLPPKSGAADPSLLSPRRKRSRESIDASDGGRNQKIPSTEETRARRSSSEERQGQNTDAKASNDTIAASNHPNGSGTTPVFGEALKPKPLEKKPDLPQTSSSVFAASGFASMSSSASGFGSFGSNSTTSPKVFGQGSTSSGFSAAGSSQKSAFGSALSATAKPPASTGTASAFGGSLGGSAFGGGFSSGFGSGAKLSSFAAPVGDTTIGKQTTEKAFGAAAVNEETGSDGSSEGGEAADEEAAEPKEEETPATKFKVQDVQTGEDNEDSVFVNRGKLFQFHPEDKAWKERGVGPFKLNIQRPSTATEGQEEANGEADETSRGRVKARFVMRNHATHKVILNTPIFKEMSVKDQSGKQLLFVCPSETGDMTTYTVRMSKEEDVKHLLELVLDLQKKM